MKKSLHLSKNLRTGPHLTPGLVNLFIIINSVFHTFIVSNRERTGTWDLIEWLFCMLGEIRFVVDLKGDGVRRCI